MIMIDGRKVNALQVVMPYLLQCVPVCSQKPRKDWDKARSSRDLPAITTREDRLG